jgi:hypothetical protein
VEGNDGTKSTLFGEVLGTGAVTAGDYHATLKRLGTRLPKLSKSGLKSVDAVLVRIPARRHHDFRGRR